MNNKTVPNKEQLEAIQKNKGAYSIIASAGSGKSFVLLSRIDNLIKKYNVAQRNILAISFTRNTAEELQSKLTNMGHPFVNVGTFHSICGKILREEGIDINPSNMIQEWQIDNCFKQIDKKADVKDIMGFIGYQKSHKRGVNDEFINKASQYSEQELREYYKAYEKLKKKLNRYDFDDYLLLCLEVVKKNPGKHTFEYILVDEYQDSNGIQNELLKHWCISGNLFTCGDFRQCFPSGTQVNTPNGLKNIEDLKVGHELISASGRGKTHISHASELLKREYEGKLISLKTLSGKHIKATPEHTIFLDTFINKEKHFIYLMYKEGMGFRIGRSKQNLSPGYRYKHRNSYETRTLGERADKSWLIKVCDTLEEATFYEIYYSSEYGLPLFVFRNNNSGIILNQEKINELYDLMDNFNKGIKLLDSLMLSFNCPHFMINADSRLKNRYRINFTMFAGSNMNKGKRGDALGYVGHQHGLSVSTTNDYFKNILMEHWDGNIQNKVNGNGLEYTSARKSNGDQDALLDLAYKIKEVDNEIEIVKRAVLTENTAKRFSFMPIANARVGMKVPIFQDEKIIEDEIVEVDIEDYSGFVYDINVDYYRNYIVDNIVVHNCIYGFNGSSNDYIMNMNKYWNNAETLNVYINYRSPQNIVEHANNFIKRYYKDYEHYKDAVSNIQEDGHIQVDSRMSRDVEAVEVVDEIEKLISNGTKLNDIAVLYRNNAHADFVENELKRRKIDYDIANDSSFFKRREIAGILSFLRLIQDTDDNNAFEGVFRLRVYPLMYFSNAVFNNIQNYANRNNTSLYEAMQRVDYDKPWMKSNVVKFVNNIERLKMEAAIDDKNVITLINDIVKKFQIEKMINEKYSHKPEREERLNSIEVLKSFVKGNNLEQFVTYVYSNTEQKKKKENAVRLMTIHRSKGLEFDNVFVIGVEDGEFPSQRDGVDILEEARLFYVAISRSKKNLWIGEIGKGNRFIKEYDYTNS